MATIDQFKQLLGTQEEMSMLGSQFIVDTENTVNKIIQMAADKGFELTKEEIAKFIAQMIEEDEFDDLELSVEALSTVAGGRYMLGPVGEFLGNFVDFGERVVTGG